MENIRQHVRQMLEEVPEQARELVLAGRQGNVPAKTVLLSFAFVALFKLATGIYCALISIAAMQSVSAIPVP